MRKGRSEWGREGEKEERSEAGTERGRKSEGDRKTENGRDKNRDDGWEVATGPEEVEGREAGMKTGAKREVKTERGQRGRKKGEERRIGVGTDE